VLTVHKMSTSTTDHLINDSKYSFLKELGLKATNFGVYDGSWKGSGEVTSSQTISICGTIAIVDRWCNLFVPVMAG
jgi:hypothetical protein